MNATDDVEGKKLSDFDLIELPRHARRERHLLVNTEDALLRLLRWAKANGYWLLTMAATDERRRLARAFKIYYVLLLPGEIIIFEYPLSNSKETTYPSIRDIFENAIPLEDEIRDMFGLIAVPEQKNTRVKRHLLHFGVYPEDLTPLRRDITIEAMIKSHREHLSREIARRPTSGGMSVVPVGPVHAGIIEAGHFAFYVAGEVPEHLSVQLGYKHRGVEKLFESQHTLENGWKLAEKVSGDSSFAHSLAYCRAIEEIARLSIPRAAQYWRALFLELERLYNHINDIGALVHDMAFERMASRMGELRETLLQLNQRLSGHRLLRGVNRPGGVVIHGNSDLAKELIVIQAVVEEFLQSSIRLMENPGCRDRMIGIGVLTKKEAHQATGMIARASGLFMHDTRIQFPQGGYLDEEVQIELRATIEHDEFSQRVAPIYPDDLQGDVFARVAIRIAEVETSWRLIQHFGKKIQSIEQLDKSLVPIADALWSRPNLEIGIGIAEGWRGDIVYFVMKGVNNNIFRCKIRDPSVFNWHVFPKAVERKQIQYGKKQRIQENILADFPLINKSFNLSYSGSDL